MACCSCRGKSVLGHLPTVLLVMVSGCFITTYAIAVYKGHVTFDFPYISDTGAMPPESCIFTFFLSLSAFLAATIIFVRYRHIVEYNREDIERVQRVNKYAFFVGLLSPLGMIMVASFQDINMFPLHLLGAGMAFGGGCIYSWMHTYITYRMHSVRRRMLDVRFLLSLLSTTALLVTCIFASIAWSELRGKFSEGHAFKWKAADGGYRSHVVSAAAEWTVGLAFLLYFLTFTSDFCRLAMDVRLRLQLEDTLLVSGQSATGTTSPGGSTQGETVGLLRSGSDGEHNQKFIW